MKWPPLYYLGLVFYFTDLLDLLDFITLLKCDFLESLDTLDIFDALASFAIADYFVYLLGCIYPSQQFEQFYDYLEQSVGLLSSIGVKDYAKIFEEPCIAWFCIRR